jgi:ATP-dependent helicase/DNAse subunit B
MPASVLAGKTEKDRSMSREEYEDLREAVINRIKETASGIIRGSIDISPLKEGRLACANCSYKPICRRDREYTRNYAREIGPKPSES